MKISVPFLHIYGCKEKYMMGNGLTVKENGKYLARVRVGGGKRESKVFDNKDEALNWIEKRKTGENIIFEMTVSKWFKYWIGNLMTDIRANTVVSYKSKYKTWIGPVIGNISVKNVKPFHCMEVLNRMKASDLKSGSIDQVRIVMHEMFSYAVENGLCMINPVTKSVKASGKTTKFMDTRCLSRKEQELFLEEASHHKHFEVFSFILQTGLRYGELTGLQWGDIDLDNRTMKIQRSASFLEDHGEFIVGEPKSINGYRTIFLTDTALNILKSLPKTSIYVFPIRKRAIYNTMLKRIAQKIGIEPFSIHKLRHTFATRCMESGMKPKTLQKILGHSDITVTLNYYVHINDDQMALEMINFEAWAPGGNQTCKALSKAL